MESGDEGGYILMETLVALPVLVFLLSFLGGCILWMIKTVTWQKADWETEEEVRYAMERIVDDASRAEYADIYRDGERVYLYYWGAIDSWNLSRPPATYAKYYKIGIPSQEDWWLCAEKTGMPLTDDSLLGKVSIVEFRCTMATPHIFHVKITGRSRVTGHEFSLETAVHIKGSG